MKTVWLLVLVLALAGCSSSWNALQGGIADRGAALSDEAVQSAEFLLCRGITVGAWIRRYGSNPQLASAWRALCGTALVETPAPAPKDPLFGMPIIPAPAGPASKVEMLPPKP